MLRRLLLIVAAVGCLGGGGTAAAVTQCRRADQLIQKQIRFARGRTTAVIKDRVRLCTMHEYHFRARAGQKITAHLVTGNRTSMTLFTPNGETVFVGTKDFEGELPEGGEYSLQIGTDATAAYTLEISIR